MAREYRIEAYAIISADGMIADAQGRFPEALKNDADKRFFHAALDSAAAIALGRLTHEQERNSGRRRLVLTRRVDRAGGDGWTAGDGARSLRSLHRSGGGRDGHRLLHHQSPSRR